MQLATTTSMCAATPATPADRPRIPAPTPQLPAPVPLQHAVSEMQCTRFQHPLTAEPAEPVLSVEPVCQAGMSQPGRKN